MSAQRRSHDEAVRRIGMEVGQTDGVDANFPIDSDLEHALRQLLPAPQRDILGDLIRPLAFSMATSQNEIADTATSPDCHARSISTRAVAPSSRSPNLSHSITWVSSRITCPRSLRCRVGLPTPRLPAR